MAGRRRLPHSLHILKHTDRKRNRPTPDLALTTLAADTPPPPWLPPEAREGWARILPILANAGIATPLDVDAIAARCVEFARWRSAVAELERTGATITTPTGHVRPSPLVGVAASALRNVRALDAALGLSPSSRLRVARTTPPTDGSPLDRFIRK